MMLAAPDGVETKSLSILGERQHICVYFNVAAPIARVSLASDITQAESH
jgi:hypothetical protein